MKKGFTLIELLAVIVILAVIALIVTPVISNIINNAKKAAAVQSAREYISAANNVSALLMLDNKEFNIDSDNHIFESGNNEDILTKIEVSGKAPSYIYLDYNVTNKIVSTGKFCINGFSVDYINNNASISTNDYCNTLEPGYYDMDGNLLASWDKLVNEYGLDIEKNYDMYPNNRGDSHLANVIEKNFKKAGKLVVSDKVTKIGANSFDSNYDLHVVLPDSILTIGERAFGKIRIKSINIPKNVERIEQYAFTDANLTFDTLKLPDSLTYIGTMAFENNKIKTLIIGSGLTTIDRYTFLNTEVENIIISDDNKTFDNRDNCNCIIDTKYNKIVKASINTTVIPESIIEIGTYSFSDSMLESIVIPSNVTIIGFSAFKHVEKNYYTPAPAIGTVTTFSDPNNWHACTGNTTSCSGSTFQNCKCSGNNVELSLSDASANTELMNEYANYSWLKY